MVISWSGQLATNKRPPTTQVISPKHMSIRVALDEHVCVYVCASVCVCMRVYVCDYRTRGLEFQKEG